LVTAVTRIGLQICGIQFLGGGLGRLQIAPITAEAHRKQLQLPCASAVRPHRVWAWRRRL